MKLDFELVPDGCWGYNLRSVLKKEGWDAIRKSAYARADGRCMICGAPSSRLEAHEVWSYSVLEGRGVQKLENVIALCSACHAVVHIGRTQLKGDVRAAEEHFMRVNGVTYAEYRKALGEANKKHSELNRIGEWSFDLSKLKEFLP